MEIDAIIKEIISTYGVNIMLGVFSLFITGFFALWLKNLVSDVFNYLSTKMSDLGYGAMILWNGKLKRVVEIKFRRIKAVDDEEIIFIPIETWLKSVQSYPQARNDQFDERKWYEKPWDGRVERRKSEHDRKSPNAE